MLQSLRRTASVAGRFKVSPVKMMMSSAPSFEVDLGHSFVGHLTDVPSSTTSTNKDELVAYLKKMYAMRRMEITCDNEYKARTIRGFCHLYDGQEAIAMGMDAALTLEDSIITSYRCHSIAITRGITVEEVFAELFGFASGATKGIGGSMHFYRKSHNFYGGQGIVGAQVPVGAGLAFANKYNTPEGEKMPVALAMYGDGAANQGQIWEAANMAALYRLPLILIIENNHYGMGTTKERSSSNNDYYTMGNKIPGMRINGMNVLAVREGLKFVKDYCASGNGPMYVEMDTYRYHGHSMSDPGTTYRTRDEVGSVRMERDPIEYVKKLLEDNGCLTAEEIKKIEKEVRGEVNAALKAAKSSSFPTLDRLTENIFSDNDGKNEKVPFVRMPDYTKSVIQ
jgi:pyruvate dehydrogenase E1 component alpha subunit